MMPPLLRDTFATASSTPAPDAAMRFSAAVG
jgi:hypothetical protein